MYIIKYLLICIVIIFLQNVIYISSVLAEHNNINEFSAMPIYNPPTKSTHRQLKEKKIRGFNISKYHNYGRRVGKSQGQSRGFNINQYHNYGRRRGVHHGQIRSFNIQQYHNYGRRPGTSFGENRGFNIADYHNYGRRKGISHGLRRGFNISKYHNFGRRRGKNIGQERRKIFYNKIPEHIISITPEHVGLTSKEQTILLWYISDSWPDKIEFSLNEFGTLNPEPILELQIDNIEKEGIYAINLKDYNIKLKLELEYEFFFAIVLDETERTADILTSGTIKFIKPSKRLIDRLQKIESEKHYYIYADEGYWYDALESLSKLIIDHPDNPLFKKQRSYLIEQINLPLAAAYDKNTLKKLRKIKK